MNTTNSHDCCCNKTKQQISRISTPYRYKSSQKSSETWLPSMKMTLQIGQMAQKPRAGLTMKSILKMNTILRTKSIFKTLVRNCFAHTGYLLIMGRATFTTTRTGLASLLIEILCQIMRELQDGNDLSHISSGLTCSTMYFEVFRYYHKGPIPNRQGLERYLSHGRSYPFQLQAYIAQFLGLSYRLRKYNPCRTKSEQSDTPFLAVQEYGFNFGPAEEELANKWHDWKLLKYACEEVVLPSPFGRGHDWYELLWPRIHEYLSEQTKWRKTFYGKSKKIKRTRSRGWSIRGGDVVRPGDDIMCYERYTWEYKHIRLFEVDLDGYAA